MSCSIIPKGAIDYLGLAEKGSLWECGKCGECGECGECGKCGRVTERLGVSLHSTLNILHPTPYTQHPTPHTPHPTPYTPHPRRYYYKIPSFCAIDSIRSITRQEYPHSLSYQDITLKKLELSSIPAPASKVLEWESPTKSIETTNSSV